MSGLLAIDLGTSRTLVADLSGKVVFDEPSVAATTLPSGRLLAFGSPALAMPGRSAGQVGLVRPVAHGQLQDLALTGQIAVYLLEQLRRVAGRRPAVMLAVPGLASGVQRRALERAFSHAGSSRVDFVEHALAAGIGLGLDLEAPVASMVVDAGGGTTDIAVMALGGVVTEASLPVGGDDLDAGIRDLCLRSFDLLISPRAAEQVKLEIGSAWPEREEDKLQLTGRDISNGMERTVVLTSSEVAGAIAEPLRRSVRAVANCIVDSPPDLANDLVAQGIHLVGEAGQLGGYAKRLATSTGIPVHLSASPGRAAVVGAARCAQELKGRSSGRSGPRRPGGPASRGPRARG